MLTGPRSITSSIATQYVFLSRHAAVLINHWTVAFTSCKIAFNGHHLLDKWIYLRLMHCLSTFIKKFTFQHSFIIMCIMCFFMEGHYCIVSSICRETIDMVWYDYHGNGKYCIFCCTWQPLNMSHLCYGYFWSFFKIRKMSVYM